ncbi:MAG: DinB family protein [Vicinamibacterales bacterium]
MQVNELVTDLYHHMEWADASAWATVLRHDTARHDGLIRGTLHHIHLVQQAFLAVWQGDPIDRHAGEGLEAAALAAWARPYYARARAHVAASAGPALDTPLTVPWSGQIAAHLGFEPGPTTLGETMVQVYAHTGHHRGQVLSRLRALDVTPPLVDYIAWLWQRRPPAAWT